MRLGRARRGRRSRHASDGRHVRSGRPRHERGSRLPAHLRSVRAVWAGPASHHHRSRRAVFPVRLFVHVVELVTSRARTGRGTPRRSRQGSVTAGGVVVEIGSNDGYLSAGSELGFRAVGVDPSTAMAISRPGTGSTLTAGCSRRPRHGELAAIAARRPQLIVANNVFNHSNDPLDFAEGVVSYWSVRHVCLRAAVLAPNRRRRALRPDLSRARQLFLGRPSPGISFGRPDWRSCAPRKSTTTVARFACTSSTRPSAMQRVESLVAREKAASLFDRATYPRFMNDIRAAGIASCAVFSSERRRADRLRRGCSQGQHVPQLLQSRRVLVDWVTDASPPRSASTRHAPAIPIAGDEVLARYDRVHAIITSWNLAETLRKNAAGHQSRIEFLNPYEESQMKHRRIDTATSDERGRISDVFYKSDFQPRRHHRIATRRPHSRQSLPQADDAAHFHHQGRASILVPAGRQQRPGPVGGRQRVRSRHDPAIRSPRPGDARAETVRGVQQGPARAARLRGRHLSRHCHPDPRDGRSTRFMKRVLLTGASGFIGRHLAAGAESDRRPRGRRACQRGLDLRDRDRARSAFREPGPVDYVIHAADVSGEARWAAAHAGTQF